MATKAKPSTAQASQRYKERCEEAYAELIEIMKDAPGFVQLISEVKRDCLYTESANPMITMLLVGTDTAVCRIGFYYNANEMGVATDAVPGSPWSGHVVHPGNSCTKETLVAFAVQWLSATTVEKLNKMISSKKKV